MFKKCRHDTDIGLLFAAVNGGVGGRELELEPSALRWPEFSQGTVRRASS